jgi:hypothetical protein
MITPEDVEDIEIEAPPVRAARLTFLGSLAFWPLFLAATVFMLPAVGKTTAAVVERNVLVDGTWLYPVAVAVGWLLSKRGLKRGSPDVVCLLPWLIPALVAAYWLVYFLL